MLENGLGEVALESSVCLNDDAFTGVRKLSASFWTTVSLPYGDASSPESI